MDTQKWQERLRNNFNAKYYPQKRNICLPNGREGAIRFAGTSEAAIIELKEDAVCANMQSDIAAFEGWALALLTLGGATEVEIRWERPRFDATPALKRRETHYQRFLYRTLRFSQLLGKRVILNGDDTDCHFRKRLAAFLGGAGSRKGARSSKKGEYELELEIVESDLFRRKFQFCGRQLPVGVFSGEKPSSKNRIFTGGSSAIDLFGVEPNGALWIFELKQTGNIKVGSLSELFFYSMLMLDIRHGDQIRLADNWTFGSRLEMNGEALQLKEKVHARLLASDFHPLITEDVLAILNNNAKEKGWAIDFGMTPLGDFISDT